MIMNYFRFLKNNKYEIFASMNWFIFVKVERHSKQRCYFLEKDQPKLQNQQEIISETERKKKKKNPLERGFIQTASMKKD